MHTILMSIRPLYSRRIFEGRKQFELRRSTMKLALGDRIVVYETAPTKAVVGFFGVKGVIKGDPAELWQSHGKGFGISKTDYFDYFLGKSVAHAIEIGELHTVDPVPLDTLRDRIPKFRPPQSYMRWQGPLDLLIAKRTNRS